MHACTIAAQPACRLVLLDCRGGWGDGMEWDGAIGSEEGEERLFYDEMRIGR
jgi:hypothetical protein